MFNRSLSLVAAGALGFIFIHVFDTRRNRSEQWRADCPKPRRIVFPNRSSKAGSLTNIWKRFWIPLQIDQGTQFSSPRHGFHPLPHAAASLIFNISNGRPSDLKP
jgi:hypothetical protein